MALGFLTLNPALLNLTHVPMTINIEGLELDGFQCFGLTLRAGERQNRATELISIARRSLIAEVLELGADALVRAIRILRTGSDPYDLDEYFSADIRDLWNSNSGKAGFLLSSEDRVFIEKCVAPMRNFIRHNNSRIPPKKNKSECFTLI